MKIVFFGTPYYVLPVLDALNKSFRNKGDTSIEAVVTQSPKPEGRNQTVQYSPVDQWAHKRKIPIYFDSRKLIQEKVNADFGVLASYGALIPPEVINHFPKGILVIHPSLLPEFRGSSPVPAMIATNSENIGVSILKMDDKLDHGPIITSFRDEILPDDNCQTLRDRLFERSAQVLTSAIPAYLAGKIKLKSQDDRMASFARMIKKEDAFIPPKYLKAVLNGKIPKTKWSMTFIKGRDDNSFSTVYSPESIDRFVRAMSPWPQVWTMVSLGGPQKVQKRMKILKSSLDPVTGSLELEVVQMEGKNPTTWKQFIQGHNQADFN